MADGIQIRDAAVAISPAGLEAMLRKEGAALTVSRLDLSVSAEALNTLLQGLGTPGTEAPPEGPATPAQLSGGVEQGRLQLAVQREGKTLELDLRMAGMRLDFTAEGLRLVGE